MFENWIDTYHEIDIPRRWQKTGRMYFAGRWIDIVKVIKVDRSPVTREWTAGHDTGTSSKNEGIWIESEDSVSFSTGFNCTAYIKETDAAKFLYHYPNGRLAVIMDNQVRAEIQSKAAEIAALYKMDELRTKKGEIIKGVREHVVPFFRETGISVTTIGMFGGFTYEKGYFQQRCPGHQRQGRHHRPHPRGGIRIAIRYREVSANSSKRHLSISDSPLKEVSTL